MFATQFGKRKVHKKGNRQWKCFGRFALDSLRDRSEDIAHHIFNELEALIINACATLTSSFRFDGWCKWWSSPTRLGSLLFWGLQCASAYIALKLAVVLRWTIRNYGTLTVVIRDVSKMTQSRRRYFSLVRARTLEVSCKCEQCNLHRTTTWPVGKLICRQLETVVQLF